MRLSEFHKGPLSTNRYRLRTRGLRYPRGSNFPSSPQPPFLSLFLSPFCFSAGGTFQIAFHCDSFPVYVYLKIFPMIFRCLLHVCATSISRTCLALLGPMCDALGPCFELVANVKDAFYAPRSICLIRAYRILFQF